MLRKSDSEHQSEATRFMMLGSWAQGDVTMETGEGGTVDRHEQRNEEAYLTGGDADRAAGGPSPMRRHELPFPRSYWVDYPRLLAGAYPGDADPDRADRKIEGLVDVGIRLVVNLMEETETGHDGAPFASYEEVLALAAARRGVRARMERYPIPDVTAPTPGYMATILDVIDSAIAPDNAVYIHCWGGRGRTGTVVGCWLARHGVATGAAALDRIAELRAGTPDAAQASPETADQNAMVVNWRVGQ